MHDENGVADRPPIATFLSEYGALPRQLAESELAVLMLEVRTGRLGFQDDRTGALDAELREALPAYLHWHYDQCRVDARIVSFFLFLRSPQDGMIVVVDRGARNHILATWDTTEERMWIPNHNRNGPLVAPLKRK